MSIVVLKKKSRRYQHHISGVGHLGFALNGTLRNIGSVGPTNLAKSVTRTPFRGIYPMGNGGCTRTLMYGGANRGSCNGGYPIVISNSGSCCVNDPNIVKLSVKNTNGMLNSPTMLGCCDDIVKYPPNNGSESLYIKNLQSKCVVNMINKEPYTRCINNCPYNIANNANPLTQDTYINSLYLKYNCLPTPLDKQPLPKWINNNTNGC